MFSDEGTVRSGQRDNIDNKNHIGLVLVIL